ncbi:MAG TPA: ubiquinol-cytochrome c reductase iron-sulfur subunit [Candidatus Dormibacteraeota bacterium]|jgi:menaquinol-cytochrome c reductase iron-sulfur subunit|nr:ubiquinol-cytochrome c reductase iron-sulfur subunit [Candidatus Dormibacteraeota bacterium]
MAPLDRRRLTRRQFALLGTQVAGATVAVLLGIPIIGFLISPLFRRQAVAEATVGDIADVGNRQPKKYVVEFPAGDWSSAKVKAAVYVVKLDDQTKVFSNTCTHMQCPVHWDASLNQFLCPCHGGLYAIDGSNVGGPPPKPLPEYVHRFDGTTLFVENRFTESL